jgi:hypothetical protein
MDQPAPVTLSTGWTPLEIEPKSNWMGIMKWLQIIVLTTVATTLPVARAQSGAPAKVAGTVTAVDLAAKQMSFRTDKGESLTITTTDHSFLRRLPAGVTDAKQAVPIALSDITAGDRAVAIGQSSSDGKTLEARTIYVMTRADVAQVHAKEQEDWQKRGVAGLVSAVDPATRTITIKVAQREYAVHPGEKTEFLRYALDSSELADAKPGTFADVKVGDELHVLGDHSADGSSIAAEKIVFGSFKQIAATVENVDAQAGVLKVKDLATKKSIFVNVKADSHLKKLPEMMAQMLARRYRGGGRSGELAGGPRGGEQPAAGGGFPGRGGPEGAGPSAGAPGDPGRRGGFGAPGGGRGDLKQMLDRLPAFTLAELKPGDAIMMSTTEGTDASHLTVITLLAGVEPLLTASPQATRDIMSGWNLGGGGEGGDAGGGGN